MEPESSLPCSQDPSNGPYPEPDQSNSLAPNLRQINPVHTTLSYLSQINFNIILPYMSKSS
jgi:hypothetical protein